MTNLFGVQYPYGDYVVMNQARAKVRKLTHFMTNKYLKSINPVIYKMHYIRPSRYLITATKRNTRSRCIWTADSILVYLHHLICAIASIVASSERDEWYYGLISKKTVCGLSSCSYSYLGQLKNYDWLIDWCTYKCSCTLIYIYTSLYFNLEIFEYYTQITDEQLWPTVPRFTQVLW